MIFPIFAKIFASLAQLVEQLIRNEQVVGSSPIGGSEKVTKISRFRLTFKNLRNLNEKSGKNGKCVH
jgi:hypothetical protein